MRTSAPGTPASIEPSSPRGFRAAPASPFAATLALALLGAAIHLVFLLTYRDLNLSGDEAHYWEWSRRLDISYYSKGPLVAYIIAGGRAVLGDWSHAIFGNDTLAVRGPAILLGVLTSLGIHVLAARVFRDGWVGTLAVALSATIPIVSVGGLLMTIDAPLVCAWVWCLYCVVRAVEGERRSYEAPERRRGGESEHDAPASAKRQRRSDEAPEQRRDGKSAHDAPASAKRQRRSAGAPERRRWNAAVWWLGVGGLIAVGLLAKYNMLLAYAVVGILLLAEPALRVWWRTPIVYVAALVGLLGLLPILIWNASHDWVSFRHVAGQAGVGDRVKFDIGAIAAYVGGQAGVIGPIWLAMMLWALRDLWKSDGATERRSDEGEDSQSTTRKLVRSESDEATERRSDEGEDGQSTTRKLVRSESDEATERRSDEGASKRGARSVADASTASPLHPFTTRVLVLAAAVPWIVFLLFAPITKIQPNWPAMALPPATIALAWRIRSGWNTGPATMQRWLRRLTYAGVGVGLLTVLIAHRTDLLMPIFKRLAENAPPWDLTPTSKYDPAFRLRGWAELGRAVGEVLTTEKSTGREPFIVCDEYQMASEVAFYTPGNPVVYSAASVLGWRRSQYDIWQNPIRDAAEFVGRPCIYVGTLHADVDVVEGATDGPFPGLKLAREVVHRVQGAPMQIWTIYTCERFAGFASGPANRY